MDRIFTMSSDPGFAPKIDPRFRPFFRPDFDPDFRPDFPPGLHTGITQEICAFPPVRVRKIGPAKSQSYHPSAELFIIADHYAIYFLPPITSL
jgi:hypothetical protein